MTRLKSALAGAIAVALLTMAAVASPAPPTLTVDKSFGKVANWSIGYSKSLNGCLAAASYADQTTILFGFGGANDNDYLAFTNPKWRAIEVGQVYKIRMRAHGLGAWQGSFVGFARNGDRGLFAAGLKDKFVSDLSDSDELTVEFEGKRIAVLSLVGSSDALQAVIGCQKDPNVVADAKADVAPVSGGEEAHKGEKSSQGTGFYVSDKGHVLTNNHVIDGCTEITVTHIGSPAVKARLVATDSTNDLAVLSTDEPQAVVPPLTMRARIGETVYAYGYPLNGILATSGNFTIGNVTATAGLGDDTRQIQISAPVQPGNSGGPLVDQYGNVVGVIVSKLNALKMASVTSDLAQNVNFAIKSTIALNFLEANGIAAAIQTRTTDPMDGEAIAEKAKVFTVRVNCH